MANSPERWRTFYESSWTNIDAKPANQVNQRDALACEATRDLNVVAGLWLESHHQAISENRDFLDIPLFD